MNCFEISAADAQTPRRRKNGKLKILFHYMSVVIFNPNYSLHLQTTRSTYSKRISKTPRTRPTSEQPVSQYNIRSEPTYTKYQTTAQNQHVAKVQLSKCKSP